MCRIVKRSQLIKEAEISELEVPEYTRRLLVEEPDIIIINDTRKRNI
jgi:hypothetical protein